MARKLGRRGSKEKSRQSAESWWDRPLFGRLTPAIIFWAVLLFVVLQVITELTGFTSLRS